MRSRMTLCKIETECKKKNRDWDTHFTDGAIEEFDSLCIPYAENSRIIYPTNKTLTEIKFIWI